MVPVRISAAQVCPRADQGATRRRASPGRPPARRFGRCRRRFKGQEDLAGINCHAESWHRRTAARRCAARLASAQESYLASAAPVTHGRCRTKPAATIYRPETVNFCYPAVASLPPDHPHLNRAGFAVVHKNKGFHLVQKRRGLGGRHGAEVLNRHGAPNRWV